MEKINYIFGLIAFLIIIAGAILVAVSFDEEENLPNTINQSIKTFEIKEKPKEQPYIIREYQERYTDKMWEHYDKVDEARERTGQGR